jgi:hypothetical protein
MVRKAITSMVKMAFEGTGLRVPIANIQPLRLVSSTVKQTPKYTQIAASIREVGIVESPVVARNHSEPNKYLLLDGHLRRGDPHFVRCNGATAHAKKDPTQVRD